MEFLLRALLQVRAYHPWKLVSAQARPTSCALGIRSIGAGTIKLEHELAQIFDELGNGLILRGTPVDISRKT